jgi:alpha,alpha-trehalase
MKKHLPLLLLFLAACRSAPEATQTVAGPDEQLGELFVAVQTSGIFPDSKTFPDCEPLQPYAVILKTWQDERGKPDFSLKTFVSDHFKLPENPATGYRSDSTQSAADHINALWPVLTRQPDAPEQTGSRLPLPHRYVVPGGRFREMYYWDSYFTMFGLATSGRDSLVRSMVDNFAHLVNTYGHIPNGTRSYYLSRSQPPYFALMVRLLAEKDSTALTKYLLPLQKEYYFWMSAATDEQARQTTDSLAKRGAYRRAVRLDSVTVNRYFDDRAAPRPEAYKEDVTLAKTSGRPAAEVYRHLRAAAESGWDFSSRWLTDGQRLETIHTTDFVPVDLNCLLFLLEKTLADGYRQAGDTRYSATFERLAEKRRRAILAFAWNPTTGFFHDYNFKTKRQSPALTLAGVFPLFAGIAMPEQANAVAAVLEKRFLKPGGLPTTLARTGQQWDAPNGWAPLQWIALAGLRRYGQTALAERIKTAWVGANLRVYKVTGKMTEKYNVEDLTLKAGGGEYPNQDGFGWTNGVLLKLLTEK